jgi:hypothetical protein
MLARPSTVVASPAPSVLAPRLSASHLPAPRLSALCLVVLSLVVLSLVALAPSPMTAQEPTVRAFLTPGSAVGVGRAFVLNVEVTGTQSMDREPAPPELDFAQYLGSSTQSSVRMVNGRTSVSLTVQYRYQALDEGSFTIPSLRVTAAGHTLDTEPLQVAVTAAPPDAAGADGPVLDPNELFITAEASKRSVRVGEPVLLEYRIWTRVDVTNFGMTRVPEPEGFWVEDVTPSGQPEVEQLTRNGLQYASAVIRRVALVPTRAGERRIEAIGLEAQVRVRSSRDPFESFFGRSSLFGTTTVPTTVLSDEVVLDVAPLPSGPPEPFSGIVGSLDVTASLDRDSLEAGEAVTLTVRVRGDGNVRAVPDPELGLPSDFEVFPPEVTVAVRPTASGLSGAKTFEYVLIPRAPGRREIPAVRFGYYDVAVGAYRTAESAALPLTVTGTVVDGPAALRRGGVEQLREDIRFIRIGPLELRRTGGTLLGAPVFWMLFLLPLAAVGGAVALRRHRDLLEGDVAYARGRRASRVARKRLVEASRLAPEDDARAFYTEVARALRGLVADRLNLAEAGLLTTELDEAVARVGVDEATRTALRDCLDHCDRQRFAPPGSGAGERSRFLEEVGALMTALDRSLR